MFTRIIVSVVCRAQDLPAPGLFSSDPLSGLRYLQENPGANLIPLKDLLARLAHVLLPLDMALPAALL